MSYSSVSRATSWARSATWPARALSRYATP